MDAVLAVLQAEEPVHVVAGVETLALLAPAGNWAVLRAEWRWSHSVAGSFSLPPEPPYVRRVTGGDTWPGRPGMIYLAILAPRRPPTPPSLEEVHRLARALLGARDPRLLSTECGAMGAAGKLAQRPLIEVLAPRECAERILSRFSFSAEERLEPGDLRGESLERHSSVEWLMPRPREAASFRVENSSGFYVEFDVLTARDPPLIEWAWLYTNAFLYPPAQLALLLEEFRGSPPSRSLGFQFLNSAATLVEFVGIGYSELRETIMSAMEALEREVLG